MNSKKSSNKITKDLFVWCFALFLMVTIAIGEVDQGQIILEEQESSSVSIDEVDISESGEIKMLSFERNKSIKDGLRILSALFQKNIVSSAKVDGPLTVTRLYDVTFIQAFEAVIGPSFKYEQQGNIINVYTAEEYKQIKEDPERMVYKVFTLYYISAAEVMKLIAPVLSEKALVQASSAAETTLPGESISSGQGGGDTPASNDRMVVKDFPENISEVEKLIDEFDVRPKQVLVEATILSANLTEGMELGVNLNLLGGVALDGSSSITSYSSGDSMGNGTWNSNGSGGGINSFRGNSRVSLLTWQEKA